MKRFNTSVIAKFFRTIGSSETVGGTAVTVLTKDSSGNVTEAKGTSVPSDASAGYAVGCKFTKTNGSVATTLYINEGTALSCDFNAMETSASTVTAVVAGGGLIGGGTDGSVTLDVGTGPGIDVQADNVGVADSYLKVATVTITNAEMLALRATPKTLVAAPGAGRYIEFISGTLFFDYTGAYTETADNMQIKFTNGAGAGVSEAIEATGFVDATADTIMPVGRATSTVIAKTASENQALVLHNTGDGEYGGGNAANVVRATVVYRVHSTGF